MMSTPITSPKPSSFGWFEPLRRPAAHCIVQGPAKAGHYVRSRSCLVPWRPASYVASGFSRISDDMRHQTISSFYLWLFTILVFGRVLGQLVVARFAPRWLPPFEQWQSGLLPYPALLAGQAVVLTLMFWISIDFFSQRRILGRPATAAGAGGTRLELRVPRGDARAVRHPNGPATGPAMARRDDSHHFSLGRGGVPMDIRDLPCAAALIHPAASRASRPMLNNPPRMS